MNEPLKTIQHRLVQQNINNTPFFEMLQANPSLALQSAEDAKCMALLSALGVLEDFTRASTPNTSTLAVDGHPTHWIFACCYSGNDEAKENGYSVVCMPRLTCSRQQFYDFVKEMVEKIGGTAREERTICRPDDWRNQN